jgi:hypothetical protein
MVDGAGTTTYSYDAVGQPLGEGGPWPDAEELRKRKLTPEALAARRSSNRKKKEAATKLRRETTMKFDRVAERLGMGSGAYAANCVRAFKKLQQYAKVR